MFWDKEYDNSVRPFLSIEIQFQSVCLQFKSATRTRESNEEKNRIVVRKRDGESGGL